VFEIPMENKRSWGENRDMLFIYAKEPKINPLSVVFAMSLLTRDRQGLGGGSHVKENLPS